MKTIELPKETLIQMYEEENQKRIRLEDLLRVERHRNKVLSEENRVLQIIEQRSFNHNISTDGIS